MWKCELFDVNYLLVPVKDVLFVIVTIILYCNTISVMFTCGRCVIEIKYWPSLLLDISAKELIAEKD